MTVDMTTNDGPSPSTADIDATDEYISPAGNVDPNAGAGDNGANLDSGATGDADIPQGYHNDPAWQRIIRERNEARQSAETLAAQQEQNREWARLAQAEAESYGFRSPAEYQQALADARINRDKQQRENEERARIAELQQTWANQYEEPIVDVLTQAEQRAIRAEQSSAARLQEADKKLAQTQGMLQSFAIDKAKADLGPAYTPKVEKLLRSFAPEAIPEIVQTLKGLSGDAATKASSDTQAALAEGNATPPILGRSGTATPAPATGGTDGGDMTWFEAFKASRARRTRRV